MKDNLIHFPIEKTKNIGKYRTTGTIEMVFGDGFMGETEIQGYHHQPINGKDIEEMVEATISCFNNVASVNAINLEATDPDGNVYMIYKEEGNIPVGKGVWRWIKQLISRLQKR